MKQIAKLLLFILCIFAFTACSTISSKSQSTGAQEPDLKTTQLLQQAIQQNPDTVAWLTVPGTEIDQPVLQSDNNDTYLRRNELGQEDIWGCYYADYYSDLTGRLNLMQNTVIYGHSAKDENPDGQRFSQLYRFVQPEFLQANPMITLGLNQEILQFEIFAVFFTDTSFYYIDPNPSNQGFEVFLQQVEEKNIIQPANFNVTDQDKLLTLSTCSTRYDTENTGEYRLVVMAKLIKPIE